MSYNHGPMLSKALFDEFLAPYYRPVAPVLKDYGVSILIDSDGQVDSMIPWLEAAALRASFLWSTRRESMWSESAGSTPIGRCWALSTR